MTAGKSVRNRKNRKVPYKPTEQDEAEFVMWQMSRHPEIHLECGCWLQLAGQLASSRGPYAYRMAVRAAYDEAEFMCSDHEHQSSYYSKEYLMKLLRKEKARREHR